MLLASHSFTNAITSPWILLLLQVLYNILDWPTKPHSKLIVIGKAKFFLDLFVLHNDPLLFGQSILAGGNCLVIMIMMSILTWITHAQVMMNLGIANTMDLPEKLLPRISSRMGIQRLCFGPYNYQQLQEIISSRLKGIDVFEKQAIEFASRKVRPYVIMKLNFLNFAVLHCDSIAWYDETSPTLETWDFNVRLLWIFDFPISWTSHGSARSSFICL